MLMREIMENFREAEQITLPPAEQRQVELFQRVQSLLQQIRALLSGGEEDLEEKKEKKKNCSDFGGGKLSGANPYHRKDGKFGSREEDGSWSLRNAEGSNCKRGQARLKGKRELYTKIKCGRGEKWRCKDGSNKYTDKE